MKRRVNYMGLSVFFGDSDRVLAVDDPIVELISLLQAPLGE